MVQTCWTVQLFCRRYYDILSIDRAADNVIRYRGAQSSFTQESAGDKSGMQIIMKREGGFV